MESFLNPIYNGENPDTALQNSQDYEESLPHDLFDEVARPWVATVHTSEGRHRDEGSPSRNTHPPQSDDQASQLLHLIPQLDQSQIQTLMTALKGKAASSPSPRAGASRPAAATSGPHVTMGRAENTLIRPRTIRFTPFEFEHYIPRESRPRSPPYQPCYSPHRPEPRARPTSRASSIYAQPSAAPDMMSEWASIKKELQELRKQVDHRQHHDVHMPNFNGLWVPSPSELPKYRKYNGSGNPYTHIKDFIYESAPYQHDRRLMAYLFRRSLDGHALDWFYSLLPEDAEDFAVVKAKFLEQFQDMVGPEYSLTDLIAEKMKPDEDFSAYADRWRQMATRVPGYLPEGEKVKIIIANATPAYRNILAMNDISNMHQLYSRARFIQTQLKDSPIHSMFEPQKSRFQRKPQGPVTEGVQVNEQVSAFNPTGQSQNRQYNAQGQNLTNPPQGQQQCQYSQVPPPDGSQQRRPMGPRRAHYPPLPETLSDIFLALLSTDAIRLPPERPLNPSVDQTRYCVFHRQPGHTIDQCFTFKDLVYDLHEQKRIDWTALWQSRQQRQPPQQQQQQHQQPLQDLEIVHNPLPNYPPASNPPPPQQPAQVNPIVHHPPPQANWTYDDELDVQQMMAINQYPIQSQTSQPAYAAPQSVPPIVSMANAVILPASSAYTPVASPPIILPFAPSVSIPLPPIISPPSPIILPPPGPDQPSAATLSSSRQPPTNPTTLRSGRVFRRPYPPISTTTTTSINPQQVLQPPQQQQAQQQAQDEGLIEPLPGTHYDILKHLDHVPAKISILELIKKSKEHQEALRNFLQKVVVNEDMMADKLPSALAMVTRGPAITFAESELAPPEARRLPLCVTLVINHIAVGAALVDTGASINVCPLSTLRACDLSETNKPIVSVLDINYPWSYTFQSQREVNLARVNAVKRKEPLSTKGWQIMMKLGYEEGKGLGAELQGIVKPISDIITKSRWGLGYREKSKPWSSSTSTLKADREPLTWTLWCHFIRGPTQPGYNTVVVEVELSQHEVHGRNFSRHMAPLLTYRALEALRPTRRRKTGDPEAEWYRWFDIEDITIAFSQLFWEEERTWPPAAEEFLVPSSPPLLIQLTPQLLTAAHSLLTPELPPAVLSTLQADPGDHEVEEPAYVLHSVDQGHPSTEGPPPAPSLGAILFEDTMSSPSPIESSSLGESRVGKSRVDRPRIESQVIPPSANSKHRPRKQRGKAIPRRYLQELARRCQALLLIEEFTREALVFEEVFEWDGVFIDDGFGVYEIMNDEDPVDEEDSEVLSTYRTRDPKLKPYQDLVTLLARQFRKLIYIHTPRSQNILADTLALLASSLSFPLSRRTETIIVQRLDVPSTQDPWFRDLRATLEEKARRRGAQQVMLTELEEILNEEELPWGKRGVRVRSSTYSIPRQEEVSNRDGQNDKRAKKQRNEKKRKSIIQ
ncbi:hypothetical protein Taro_030386 [Colocasia esculenta]|uniref:G-patch domain-containing protein n=1 Tax=Colocasia esculenta TaxID=4460 RepID=A0A843VW02_COLES|nr:hypothetical protein [Colocasia esculenta]